MSTTASSYAAIRAESAANRKRLSKTLTSISIVRILLFFLSAALIIWGFREIAIFDNPGSVYIYAGIAVFLVFIGFIRRQAKIEISRSRADALLNTVLAEEAAFRGEFKGFDKGDDLAPEGDHHWAADLDLFGEGSLFQELNRCQTAPGRQHMREHMLNAPVNAEDMDAWHTAVKSLSGVHRKRLETIAAAAEIGGEESGWKSIQSWSAEDEIKGITTSFVKVLLILVPIYSIAVIAAYVLNYLTDNALILCLILPLVIGGAYFKRSTVIYATIGRQAAFLNRLSHLASTIRALPAESEAMKSIHERLKSAQDASAQLSSIISSYDQRNNIFAALVTNALYLADLRNARNASLWRTQYKDQVKEWISAIAEAEVLVSMAGFSANHGDALTYPKPSLKPGVRARKMLHPLMLRQVAVPNAVDVEPTSQITLVTGANMAGKSTYLRAIGLNVLLARMGAPVAAESFELSNLRMFTSMRTTDSLATGTSYFMAELRRLSEVVSNADGDVPLFVLLDEILKGTNSADKEAGSRAFVEKLLKLHVYGVVATHDVSLCTLENAHGDRLVNRHFSAEVTEDDLHFDYHLREGVCDTMNATWLMQKMGLIDRDTSSV